MVRLNAYRCHDCSSVCKDSDDYFVGICVECGKLTCGPCRTLFKRGSEKPTKCKMTHDQKDCVYTSSFTDLFNFFHQFPPDDELKLLNYAKWCPARCNDKCDSSFAIQRIGYISTSVQCCRSCRSTDKATKYPPINTYMKIIDELRDHFHEEDYIFPHKKRTVQLKSFQCEKCHGNLPSPFYLAKTGDLLCENCKKTADASYTVSKGNLDFFDSFRLYIPDQHDLRLLTYSKWTPLRCELCSTLFSTNFLRTPMFHPGCCKLICNQCAWKHSCSEPNSSSVQLKWVLDVDKELRSFFKDGGNDPKKTPFQVEEKPNNPLCLPSSYDLGSLSSSVSGIPEKFSCGSCSQLNAPTNVRMCADCKKSCLCFACIIKEHWGHHIEEISTTLQTAVIQKESENTLEKLAKWKGSVTEGYRQIDAVNVKVVDNYNWLYTRAIRETDLAILREIRERGNIGQLQKIIDEFTGVQVKLRVNVEELEKSLSDIIKVTKERHGEEETVEEDF